MCNTTVESTHITVAPTDIYNNQVIDNIPYQLLQYPLLDYYNL